MEKTFELGITVGRFQTFHKGHQAVLDKAISLCGQVGVLIGSSQESGTNKNPFSYEMREKLLRKVYGDRIAVYPLPDIGVGNNATWGDYVLDTVEERFGRMPDLFISGREERRTDWFDNDRGRAIAELYIPKSIEISASQMREWFVGNDFEAWKNYCDESLWSEFPEMRKIMLAAYQNTRTDSM